MLGFHGISEQPISAIDGNVTVILDTAAAVSAAGQDVLASISMAISTGATVSISGQSVLATLGMVISTSANVIVAGQEANLWPRVVMGPLFIRKTATRPAVYWKGRTQT